MLRQKGFEILLASPPEYERLVAEIYFDGRFFALINQERGPGVFEIEIPGNRVVEEAVVRKVDLNGLRQVLDLAVRRLLGENQSAEQR